MSFCTNNVNLEKEYDSHPPPSEKFWVCIEEKSGIHEFVFSSFPALEQYLVKHHILPDGWREDIKKSPNFIGAMSAITHLLGNIAIPYIVIYKMLVETGYCN